MKITKKTKIILAVLVVLIGMFFSAQTIINYFIEHRLPAIIVEKNDSPYNISYDKIHYALSTRSLEIKGVTLTPKSGTKETEATIYSGTLRRLSIHRVDIIALLSKHIIQAKSILIDTPNLVVERKKESEKPPKTFTFIESILFDIIEVKQAEVLIKDYDSQKTKTRIHNFNTVLKGVQLTKSDTDKLIPFSFKDCTIQLDSAFTAIDKKHDVYLTQLAIDNKQFKAKQLRVKKTVGQADTSTSLDITLKHFAVKDIDWKIKTDKMLEVHIDNIKTDSALVIVNTPSSITEKKIEIKDSTTVVPYNVTIKTLSLKEIQAKLQGTTEITDAAVHLNHLNLTTEKGIQIGKVLIEKGTVKQEKKRNAKKATKEKATNTALPIVHIDSIRYNNITYHSTAEKSKHPLLSINKIAGTFANLSLIHTMSSIHYQDFTLKLQDINYRAPKYYDISLDSVVATPKEIKLNAFTMKPRMSRAAMVKSFTYADDIYNVKFASAKVSNYKWHLDEQQIFNFNTQNVIVSGVDATIFRDKTPPHNPSIKPMFSKLLRDIKFGLNIQQLKIANSKLLYEETDEKALAPGQLSFTKFNATINNIASGYQAKKLPDTTIDIGATFMNNAPLQIQWNFNILDPNDRFNISGNIHHFSAEAMRSFLHPYVRASTEGIIDKVSFNFYGNNSVSKGSFAIEYKDLKVTLYRKDGKKKRKLLSGLASIFIHKNTKGELKEVTLKNVERNQDKSFFNYLWLNVLQGLKQTIL